MLWAFFVGSELWIALGTGLHPSTAEISGEPDGLHLLHSQEAAQREHAKGVVGRSDIATSTVAIVVVSDFHNKLHNLVLSDAVHRFLGHAASHARQQ